METPALTNRDLADTFTLIGDLLEIKGEIVYKIVAYRKAADSLNNLGQDARELWKQGRLTDIPGVGKAIAEKIDELLRTGQLEFLEKLKAEVPPGLADMLKVPDVGPKKALLFWKQLGITSLAELEAAGRAGKLRAMPGLGEKSEARILAGLEALGRRSDRIPLGKAMPFAQELLNFLRGLPGVEAAEAAGSLRRCRSTVGDLDLLASAKDPAPVMAAFVSQPNVFHILGQGDVKASVEFNNRIRAQLWVHPPDQWGTALVYATGSKDHNVRLRELALKQGLSLSDHSFLKPDGSEIFCAAEEDVYQTLNMSWIPPEIREDRGEIEAALKGKLPHLVEQGDILAELHSHTTFSDGTFTVQSLAEAARRRGFKVIGITDHSGGLGITQGLTIEKIHEQRQEIERVQAIMGDSIRILQGAEVEIKADGGLDFTDEVLAQFDLVIASLHVSLRQPREKVTERLINAIRNPHVDIIGHPTGRLIPDREGADLDMDAVFNAAKESGVALEINAHPARLDLDDIYARRACELGIPLSINTDAHSEADMDMLAFGVATARRGWVEAQDVINAWEPGRLIGWLAARGG